MAYDKKIHLIGSFVVCLILSLLLPMLVSALITLIFGVVKEVIYDFMLGKGTPEWNDLLADLAGIVGAVLIKAVMF